MMHLHEYIERVGEPNKIRASNDSQVSKSDSGPTNLVLNWRSAKEHAQLLARGSPRAGMEVHLHSLVVVLLVLATLATSELLSPYYRRTRLMTNRKRLRIVALSSPRFFCDGAV